MAVVDVDTTAAYSGQLVAQADSVGPKVGSHLACSAFFILTK